MEQICSKNAPSFFSKTLSFGVENSVLVVIPDLKLQLAKIAFLFRDRPVPVLSNAVPGTVTEQKLYLRCIMA